MKDEEIPIRLKQMMDNLDKYSNNLVNTAATNYANNIIEEFGLNSNMKSALEKAFTQGSNWQRFKTNKDKLENDDSN